MPFAVFCCGTGKLSLTTNPKLIVHASTVPLVGPLSYSMPVSSGPLRLYHLCESFGFCSYARCCPGSREALSGSTHPDGVTELGRELGHLRRLYGCRRDMGLSLRRRRRQCEKNEQEDQEQQRDENRDGHAGGFPSEIVRGMMRSGMARHGVSPRCEVQTKSQWEGAQGCRGEVDRVSSVKNALEGWNRPRTSPETPNRISQDVRVGCQ